MIQAQTQMAEYWGEQFSLKDSDIEQLYNHLLEVEKPQTIEELTATLIHKRVDEEIRSIKRSAKGHKIYQPQVDYGVGDKLLFPALGFKRGVVSAVREGFNPDEGSFKVVAVDIDKKPREFASGYPAEHMLNEDNGIEILDLFELDADDLFVRHGESVAEKLARELHNHSDFVKLGSYWFVESLLVEIDKGHLHLSEAILEMYEGGPLPAIEFLPHLDLDSAIKEGVQLFSLNNALLKDTRFDNVAPQGEYSWFLHRLEPEEVLKTPARLEYDPVPVNRELLGPLLQQLEYELDDEWSDIKPKKLAEGEPVQVVITFPHRWAGTLPLNASLRNLFSKGSEARKRVVFVDDETGEEIIGWLVPEERYIFGFKEWFEANEIPVGGFLHLTPHTEPGKINVGFDRRRPQREWVRLATVSDNRLRFELKRRAVGCGYDDLLIVGTEVLTAVDAHWRRVENSDRSLVSIIAEVFPSLASLSTQDTVHAKTIYSAVNMLRRMPPGPIFEMLVRNPAFKTVGDHYWIFDSSRWQERSR